MDVIFKGSWFQPAALPNTNAKPLQIIKEAKVFSPKPQVIIVITRPVIIVIT